MKPLIILTGPTAVGKTALSLSLAGRIGGEIISADSMQVYRHMDIGTAKIKPAEMRGIPHHLIDILAPTEHFNVVAFQKSAQRCLDEIERRGKIPLVVGGTGFYIQALLYDIDFTENESLPAYRRELEALAADRGSDSLYQRLVTVDPAAAEAIHPHNHKRIIRALEYHRLTGGLISGHNQTERGKRSPYNFAYFVLNDERAVIYANIEKRVDQMLAGGLVEEVIKLKNSGCTREMVSMQGLGYKEILTYLDGECSLEEAVTRLKRDTRHLAKRQLTWFRREREVIWIDKPAYPDPEAIIGFMRRQLAERQIITAE